MVIFLFLILAINFLLGFWCYRCLFKARTLFDDRFGFNAVLTSTAMISFALALTFFFIFPDNFPAMSIINLSLGIGTGWLFGRMVNGQTLIAGVFNGGIGGMMGTMAGGVAKDPSICGLPASAFSEEVTVLFFGSAGFFLLALTVALLLFALRV
ncbi:hypothetical protein [Mesobacillus foraminis]|uniref:Uncharacterized protein n=1 Tax=Mesobacillus foraminis TaxID=279826 RepID=A0A4R2BPA3_9BACI|nr:hypothetical protein [Mesobacillus foraminis]TCN27814.1 hypothetical protein EV146_101142 [Mesobacillus foraminis]